MISGSSAARDTLKLVAVLSIVLAGLGALLLTPSLSAPAFLAVITSLFFTPVVAFLERRGLSRGWAVGVLLLGSVIFLSVLGTIGVQKLVSEWALFEEEAPRVFGVLMDRIRGIESEWVVRYPMLRSMHVSKSILNWGNETGKWFLTYGPTIMGHLFTILLVTPLLAFALMRDGPAFRRKLFDWIPNRFFEQTFMVSRRILGSLSDYLRAKMVEALLVGLLISIGLSSVGAPYALVLGIIGGVTNIIPYLGPILGAVPGLLIATFDPAGSTLAWKVGIVYGFANLIDMALIFPLVVAKLVNLHPVLLIIVVMLGQQYYGLVGMIISIPIASAIKIVLHEVHAAWNPR